MLTALLPALLLVTNPLATPAPQADFTFDRAELATSSGAEGVYGRLVATATALCAIENRDGAMAQRGIRICVADTVERAIHDMDAPVLHQIHAGRLVSPDDRPAVVQVASRD